MSATAPPTQETIAQLSSMLKALEARVTTLRSFIDTVESGAALPVKKPRGRPPKASAPAGEDRPKRELSDGVKSWLEFNKRITDILANEGAPFKRVAEAKQFASKLKKLREPSEWSDEEIIQQRKTWADEHQLPCPVCKSTSTEDPEEHKECMRTLAEGRTAEDALKEWSKAVGAPLPEEPVTEKKKAGRPKKTDEQKAADKAAREAAKSL